MGRGGGGHLAAFALIGLHEKPATWQGARNDVLPWGPCWLSAALSGGLQPPFHPEGVNAYDDKGVGLGATIIVSGSDGWKGGKQISILQITQQKSPLRDWSGVR